MKMTKTSQSLSLIAESVRWAKEQKIAHLTTQDHALNGREIQIDDYKCVNFGSCSYLGLELDQRLIDAAREGALRFGTQFSSSRAYVSLGLYEELESLLEQMFQKPCLVAPSTTLGHLSAIPVLVQDGDAVILDHQVHASVSMATQLLRARGIRIDLIRHNHLEMLESRIKKLHDQYEKVWYFGDGIYSMYGDKAPMTELHTLLEKYPKLHLYMDDAHGIGWTGQWGTGHVHAHLSHHPRLYLIGSMAKSFGASGGVLVFPDEVSKEKVKACGGTMMFSGPLQPATLAAAIASAQIHLSPELDSLQKSIRERINLFNEQAAQHSLTVMSRSHCPIRFIRTGVPQVTLNLGARLKELGFYVNVALFPSVPYRDSGLRITLTNHLRKNDIVKLLEAIKYHLPIAQKEEQNSQKVAALVTA
jgi:7-keto-8-aminopelargonate synthetase-like enzyme